MATVSMFIDWIEELADGFEVVGAPIESIDWVELRSSDLQHWEHGNTLVISDTEDPSSNVLDVLVVDRRSNQDGEFASHCWMKIISQKSSLALVELLQRKLVGLLRWESRLKTLIINGGSVQEMVDASSIVLRNFLTISDSSFRLIAYTKDYDIDDPLAQSLVKNGYHCEEAIERFRASKSITKWEKQTRTCYNDSLRITKYCTLSHVIKFDGNYYAQIVMSCNLTPYSKGLADTFDIFVGHIRSRFKHAHKFEQVSTLTDVGFFTDLLLGNELPHELIARKMGKIGYRVGNLIRLYAAKRMEDGQINFHYVAKTLAANSQNMTVVPMGETLYVLCFVDEIAHVSQSERIEKKLLDYFPSDETRVVSSSLFSEIRDAHHAVHQTEYAFMFFPKRTDPSQGLKPSAGCVSSIFSFADCLLDYLISNEPHNERFLKFCYENCLLSRIRKADTCNKTQDAELLFAYLECERHPGATAMRTGKHRNTILSRMKHVCEVNGINLDNPRVRSNLFMQYQLEDKLRNQ